MSTRLVQCRSWQETAGARLKKDAKSFFADAMKAHPNGYLLVAANASYSGYLLNSRCYPGVHMEQGIPTWCSQEHGGMSPFDRPVLVQHDDEKPAIGRVVRASYHRLNNGDAWFQDWKQPATGLNKGSGYTRLHMAIMDSAHQEMFLDKRNLTFSTSFRSPFAGCSICMTNLLEDSCDHVPGKTYELEDGSKRECYIVTGAQFNKECSVVNNPAQPWAVADEVKWIEEARTALADKHLDTEALASKFEFRSGLLKMPDEPTIAVVDGEGKSTVLTFKEGEDDTIPSRGKGGVDLPTMVPVPDLDAADWDAPSEDDDGEWALGHIASALVKQGLLLPDADLKDVCLIGDGKAIFFTGLTDEDGGHLHTAWLELDFASKTVRGRTMGTYPSSKDSTKLTAHEHSVEFTIDDLNAAIWKAKTREADYGPSHAHNLDVVVARDAEYIPSYDDCVRLADQFEDSLSDATLSAEKRNQLKSSSFCGPNRTFPVPDCSHATAARRLIGRFKGSAEAKKRILSCVARKASSLGCGEKNEKDRAGHETPNEDDMTTSNTPAPSGTSGNPAAPAGNANSDAESIATITAALKKEQDRNRELQSQADTLTTERGALQTKLTDSEKQLHRTRCEHLALLRALNGEKPSGHKLESAEGLKAYVDAELSKRTSDSITDSIRDEMARLDPKLSNLKGLGAFAETRDQARDTTEVRPVQKDQNDGKTPAKPKKQAKELV